MQQTTQVSQKQSLVLKDRTFLTLDGVEDVVGFDDAAITCRTTLGDLVIEGSSLRIAAFSAETGNLAVEGNIAAIYYEEKKERPAGGIFGRMFRK